MHHRRFLAKKVVLRFLMALGLLLLMDTSRAQKGSNCPDDLVPKLGDNKMWGYANLFGHWVIHPSYTKVSPYVESKAVVMKGLKYGVIDCEGNVVLPPDYEKLTNFKYGKIWALKNGLWGMLNDKGGTVLEHQFSQINPIAFTELSWVKKGELWGLLNEEKGTFICKPQYKLAQIMSENASLVQLNPPFFGVVNHVDCGYLLPNSISRVKKVAPHTIVFRQNNKWGVFNEWGKVVSNAEYDSIAAVKTAYDPEQKNYDLVLVTFKNNLYGLMNLGGKELLAPKYEEIAPFSDGFFRIKEKGKYGFCNRLGKVYIKPQYEDAGLFKDDQAIVKKDGKYGVIDFKNQFVMPAKYAWIGRNLNYKYYAVKEKDKAGVEKTYFYDLKSRKLSNEGFDSVAIADSSSFIRVKKEGKTRFFDANTSSYAFEGSFDKAEAMQLGFMLVSNAGKWGVIDTKGKTIVAPAYDKIEYGWFNNKMIFRTFLNGKLGIIENNGKVLLNNEYEFVVPSPPMYLKVKKDGKYGVLKNSGVPVSEFIYDFITNEAETPGIPEWPAIVVVKEKYGLINIQNEKSAYVFEPKALKIEYLEEGMYAVKEKKDYMIINAKGQPVGEGKFDELREFSEGLAAFRKGNKWGYIDRSGGEKIKAQFEDAGLFINHMAPVKQNGLWGVTDVNGKEMVRPEYDRYETQPDGTRKFYKGDKEFTLQKGGTMR